MSNLFAVTVVGKDRPGIVAGVAEALYERGCNLQDATSTILRGHFSMVLIVDSPRETAPHRLHQAIAESLGDVAVTVAPVEDAHGTPPEPTHLVSLYGADQPGIVFKAASVLLEGGANITDLASRVLGESEGAPVYALMLEVQLPEGMEERLTALGEELGVDVTVHPIEPDVL